MVMTGIIAIKPIIPKASAIPSVVLPLPMAMPWEKAKMKVADIGPLATPPASKAIPTNILKQT